MTRIYQEAPVPITRDDTRLTKRLVTEYEEKGYWGDTTLVDLLDRNARNTPDRVAFIDANRRITWAALSDRSRRLAYGLHSRGIRAGDVVAVQLPSRIEFVVALAAVARLGAVLCQYPPDYRSREVEFILRFARVRAVIVPSTWKGFDFPAMIDGLRPSLPDLSLTVIAGASDTAPARAWQSLDSLCEAEYPQPPDFLPGDANAVCRIAFTSGTTGDPKAVLHTWNTTLFTNSRQNDHWGIGAASRILVLLPVGLNVGLFAVVQTIIAGATAVLVEHFDPGSVLECIEHERITTFLTAPSGLIALLRNDTFDSRDLASLELIQTGGASTPVAVLREANARFRCPIVDVYGMLESGWASSTDPREPFEEWVGTVGRPYPWLEARILDHAGKDVPVGVEGQIAKTGPTITVGYFHNPSLNEASWTPDGWFLTGDLGYLDDHGRLTISGRLKDMIIHGGANIWPRELEELIHADARIRDVAVIGIPDDYFGESVCACVIPNSGFAVALSDVLALLEGQVAKYKLPQRLETFEAFPTGPTGKVLKSALQEEVARRGPQSAVSSRPLPE
jgi:acyl-CoA synthetase (AMP-forming)/AMP-acid ligase II